MSASTYLAKLYATIQSMKSNKPPISLSDPGWIIFSAQNPGAKKLDKFENFRLHEKLILELKSCEADFQEVEGVYGGNVELGVLIRHRNPYGKHLAALIATQRLQESVLTADGLIYRDGSCHKATSIFTYPEKPNGDYTRIGNQYVVVTIDFLNKI